MKKSIGILVLTIVISIFSTERNAFSYGGGIAQVGSITVITDGTGSINKAADYASSQHENIVEISNGYAYTPGNDVIAEGADSSGYSLDQDQTNQGCCSWFC